MKDAELIQSARYECLVFYLTKKGRQEIGSTQESPKRKMLLHTLMRNDLYIHLGCPIGWEKEKQVRKPISITSDAFYNKKDQPHFIEIDRSMPMKENRKKINQYETLSKAFAGINKELTLIFYTVTDHRKKMLERYAKGKVKIIVYSVEDLR